MIEISSGGDGVPGGYNGYFVAYDDHGKRLGYLDYQIADRGDTVVIAMVEVEPAARRQGIGLALVQRLQDEFSGRRGTIPDLPDYTPEYRRIVWGYTTDEGNALRRAWELRVHNRGQYRRRGRGLRVRAAERRGMRRDRPGYGYHFTSPQYMPSIAAHGLRGSERHPNDWRLYFTLTERGTGYMDADAYGFCRRGVLIRFPITALPVAMGADTQPGYANDRIARSDKPFVVPPTALEFRGCEDRRWRRITRWPAGGYE